MNKDVDTSKSTPSRFANLETRRMEYASLFWFFKSGTAPGGLEVTTGWSIRSKLGEQQGAWQFPLQLPAMPQVPFRPMADVEDAYGVLHRIPSPSQKVANECLEREIADRLLIFLHRVLLGQRKILISGIMKNFSSVDLVTLWGPTLPKLVGRLCYSHFSRDKTLAVLEPDCLPIQVPRTPTGSWRKEPGEPYWEDRAVRRWSREGGSARDGSPPKDAFVNAFDLVMPCGDGVTGRLGGDAPHGRQLWQKKAQMVQELLAGKTDRLEEFDLKPSSERSMLLPRDIKLPRGIKQAIRAASIYEDAKAARENLEQLEIGLTTEQKAVYEEYKREVKGHSIPEDARALVLHGMMAKMRKGGDAQQSEIRLAARTTRPEQYGKLFAQARDAVRKDLGKDAVPEDE